MAQLVLGNIGEALGRSFLPQGINAFGAQISGAALGQAVGSVAGAAIDARYLTRPLEGPRIRDFHLSESREGAGVPVVYGRMRVGAQVIWAARFKERRGIDNGKGGPRVVNHSYSLSFAVALCEGEISAVTRCWANGEPFDLSRTTWRLYKGTEDQLPDPAIEVVEGEAPAYRGTAYIVFEGFVVDDFGARMPQLSFEIVRPAASHPGRLENVARGVNLIPGSGEFALATDIVRRVIAPGREAVGNQHGSQAVADIVEAVDQLQAELPNVTRVSLVVAWFGNDLRCGECVIRPGVEVASKVTRPWEWSVAGVERHEAYVVSATDERPNYGGTPADKAVVQAIALLRERGFHVTLYPFLLMDVPPGNGRADPHGGDEQAAFPWRGRITCHPAPGEPGSPDGSAGAASQVDTFFTRDDGFRNFILHCASLANDAGGLDGFLIGSELVGLTRVRDGAGGYPAVEQLRELAAEVRAVLGPDGEISYAADWTEYGAHVRNGGDDVAFPLDALWADDAIDHVALDWYPPLGDWRDGDHLDSGFGGPDALGYLDANIEGGEGYDWFYADEADRSAQTRTPITDGAYGEPFVFRVKDVRSWWGEAHHPRVAGVRASTPTAWTPQSKPVRFVEFGVPAVDKGANQPNLFYDPKSSESAFPHFSSGERDDLIQRRAIEAFHAHWFHAYGADVENNPESAVYDGRMVPDDGVVLWTWDARPYPAFPSNEAAWSDAGNWRLGHWLNGRTGAALLPDVVADISARAGVDVDVGRLSGVVSGYRFDGPVSARDAIEPLAMAYGVDALEREGEISFRMRDGAPIALEAGRLVEEEGGSLQLVRAGMEQAAVSVRLRFIDAEADHAGGVVLSEGAIAAQAVDLDAAVALDRRQAQSRANALAEELTRRRESVTFGMTADGLKLEPGDVVEVEGQAYRILEVADGGVIRFTACAAGAAQGDVRAPAAPPAGPPAGEPAVEPEVVIADAPPLPGEEDDLRPIVFAYSDPWTRPVVVSAGADATQLSVRARIDRPCAIGRLTTGLYPHVSGRWQETSVWVKAPGAALQSLPDLAVLNGANAMLVETEAGWEMVQFAEAELVDVETWKLSRLLRGQQGTEAAMNAGAAVGARVSFLTGAEQRADSADWERGLALLWKAWRRTPEENAAWSEMVTLEGAARMWSPAHLRSKWEAGDLELSWIRRARKGGDAWLAGEPLHETAEAYRISVSASGTGLRSWDVDGPEASYEEAMMATDFPAGGTAQITVAQIGADGVAGDVASLSVTIPPP